MIVKVQISLSTSAPCPQVLVYNKSKTVWYEGDAPKKVMSMMAGRYKAFFKAKREKDGSLTLKKPAKNQDW